MQYFFQMFNIFAFQSESAPALAVVERANEVGIKY